ncbi:MAG: heparinase II/III domain-containing protein [Armatimonadota bacterium]|jgi:hypothetical protein
MPVRDPIICLIYLLVAGGLLWAAERPVMPVSVRADDLENYRGRVQPLLAMTEAQMLEIIPEQSGLYFVGCPNCDEGRQEGQFAGGGQYQPWTVEDPLTMRCSYCGHRYPSDEYPMDEALEVTTPAGPTARYPYWRDADGYRHYFGARIDYHRIRFMESAANNLARMHAITGDGDYARRSALIMHRFAQVYPGYCYHFDFPFREKIIYEGDVDPADFRGGYRTARWTWWAYMDIPRLLIEAWDQIADCETVAALDAELPGDLSAEIEGFFHTAVGQVIANRDDLHNMSPGMWRDMIHAGRVLKEPEYVHVAIERLERLMSLRFFYDGSWEEGAPSYHSQVVGGLTQVFNVAAGYSDPPGYTHEPTGRRFDGLDIPDSFPVVERARQYLDTMRLPNGRLVPMHDTWSTNRRSAPDASEAFLLPAIGHACLGRGSGESQFQAHLTWTPGLGHRHYDGLSLLLFANGRELLSDIGYTHTRARAWTLVTASHNTVVIDHENQTADASTYGSLRYFDASDPDCQVVSVDNPEVYPDRAERFRRTLAAVTIDDDSAYLIDRFEVAGGETHDYFLHGSADDRQSLGFTALGGEGMPPLRPLATLVPDGVEFTPAQNEMELGNIGTRGWAYGHLEHLSSASIEQAQIMTAEYALDDASPALRAHLLAEPGDELVTGRNISVRNARENDTALAEHTRPFVMLRRGGGQSDFVGILEPIAGSPLIEGVRTLSLEGVAAALEITLPGRRDLVIFDAEGLQATWLDRELSADAELIVLRVTDDGAASATVVAGNLRFGDLRLSSGTRTDHALLAVAREERTMLVAGALEAAPGTVVTLDHAGRRVSPYTIASAETTGANTLLTLNDDPGITWDAPASAATFVFVPHATYQGPHTVGSTPVAHMREG